MHLKNQGKNRKVHVWFFAAIANTKRFATGAAAATEVALTVLAEKMARLH